jgi:hypothetical protein
MGAQAVNVAVLDVPSILPQVGGDPVRARALASQSGGQHFRFPGWASAVPGFAKGRDVVDIHTELQHAGLCAKLGRL